MPQGKEKGSTVGPLPIHTPGCVCWASQQPPPPAPHHSPMILDVVQSFSPNWMEATYLGESLSAVKEKPIGTFVPGVP